ncbi:MAG: hypothetical protein K6F06_06380 [Bacteroidales bacterium]|nr:hypothetical protein [Bacteroidales bacterium]
MKRFLILCCALLMTGPFLRADYKEYKRDGLAIRVDIPGVKLRDYDPQKENISDLTRGDIQVLEGGTVVWVATYKPGTKIDIEVSAETDYIAHNRNYDHNNRPEHTPYCQLLLPTYGSGSYDTRYYKYTGCFEKNAEEDVFKWFGSARQTGHVINLNKAGEREGFRRFTASTLEEKPRSRANSYENVRHTINLIIAFWPESSATFETTTIASDDIGEEGDEYGEDGSFREKGTEIPWEIIGGGAVIIGTGIALGRRKRKKKNDKDKQKHSTFRMILYKNFGSTLPQDGDNLLVGARIEETNPEGHKVDRRDLSSKITIEDEENCIISKVRMNGPYQMAQIRSCEKPSSSGRAVVRLSFTGEGGTFVNHVVFKLEEATEIVMDEALTFVACSGKTFDMEFGINHFNEEVTALSADAGPSAKGVFKITAEQKKDVPGKFVVHVTECGDKKMDPGDIDRYTCDISVQSKARKKPITGSFNIYRVGLGLRLDMRAIKAYLVEFDSTYDSERLATDPKVRKKFAESKVTFKLIAEDPETGEIQAVIPDSGPDFTYEDIREESLLFRDKYGNDVPSPVGMMQPKFELVGVDTDNTVIGVIHSTAGGLLPPNRGKAKVTLKVGWKGQTFEQSVNVPVISQPFADINDTREYNNWLKENQKKYEQLVDIRSKIAYDPRFSELLPFYYKVHALVEGYDPKFGIYEPDYQKIKRVFDKYCSGEIGHYFVNDAVWTPAWTEADENFNAFVATFAKMEKSVPVIGLRIALGFFTAGASELVLTPYSGLVKMQEYVNKGGDSAWEGFVAGSKDVILWEGVFYVGGKAFEFAKHKGWTTAVKDKAKEGWSKLKENFDKLRKGSEKANAAKQATENLSKTKGFNTAGLGDKVKNAGDKVKATKEGAASKANDAIKRTRIKGDSVFSKNSVYAEECAKRARQDARKIIDEFEAVMNNPTATPEEMRRVTLMLQGNKNAQNLLRNHPSDMLRANFNAQMQEMYKKTDPVAIKKMAERLGVPESDIQVWNGATGNDARDLYLGRKIGADRDVTFQVRGKDGKWVDIKEEIMEECYAQAFDEVHFGFYSHDRQELLKTLKKFDQATVNGLEGAESYGQDLGRIIDKARQTEKLLDPQRVANTFKHKCKEFMGQGDSCRRQAESLYEAGLYDEAMRIQGYGEALVEEGIRQNVKQFKRILDPRIEVLAAKGVGKDYSLLYEKVRILESLGNPPPKDALPITLEEARVVLQDQYGTTLEQVVEECANVIEEINPLLS